MNGSALEELCNSTTLQEPLEAMREKETRFVRKLNDVGDAAIRLSCQRASAAILEGSELEEASTADDSWGFPVVSRFVNRRP